MKMLRWLLLLGAVVMEVGCGLPDVFYLFPPNVPGLFALGTPIAQISGTSRSLDIDCQFTGYELYYKFYINNTDATFTADINYGPSNTFTDLLQHGFNRVCLGPGSGTGETPDSGPGSASAPLVNIKTIDPSHLNSSGYAIKIYFDAVSPGYGFNTTIGTYHGAPVSFYTYAPPGSPSSPIGGMEIRRYVLEQANLENGAYCTPFTSNFYFTNGGLSLNYDPTQPAQVDVAPLAGVWSSLQAGGLYVMMYAVSYGIATDQTPQRSSPVYMGYTQIQVNY